ncbi:M14 family metallopeptidase [Jiangella mangrovi]|uniref:Peptidase M14 domain-containing protein n=1 Tax=Jiangella mangrovi TaxID=1524084 RepID=A0A7W9GTJ2_9ACTN|nr:M14 family metallocarboxypeptidase [Jiangella mangrovi]MBB5789785.1 hypothetical protein [Jiangella mangrovi]
MTMGRARLRAVLAVLATTATTAAVLAAAATTATAAEDLPKTGFELREGGDWTTFAEEQAYLEDIDALTERLDIEQFGTTLQGRPMHLARIGNPAPPPVEELDGTKTVFIVCSQHGNEPAPREMCLQEIRDLAFTEDPALLEFLRTTTVLVVPTANPDGREANTRGNANRTDINRDHHYLEELESQAIGRVMRDVRPTISWDAHEMGSRTLDFAMLWPRNLNVDDPLRALSGELAQSMRDVLEDEDYVVDWYTSSTEGDERIFRNVAGLRGGVGLLTESSTANPPLERVRMQELGFYSTLDFAIENGDEVQQAIAEARANELVKGASGAPVFWGGQDNLPPTPEEVLSPAACAYVLTDDQLAATELHRDLFRVESYASGRGFVPMAQEARPIVPLLFDGDARYPIVEARREYPDLRGTVVVGGVDSGVPNTTLADGCTVNNRVQEDAEWAGHGAFVRHVTAVVNELRADGVLTTREGGAIVRAAARSGVGR